MYLKTNRASADSINNNIQNNFSGKGMPKRGGGSNRQRKKRREEETPEFFK